MNIFKQFWSSVKLTANYLKVMPQLVIGAWKISRLPQPVVSVFGGSSLKKNSKYVAWAEELAHRLVSYEISIITGGGPGIMEAANLGAVRKDLHRTHTMGIGVRGVETIDHEEFNPSAKYHIVTDYFALRKYLLINYSYAYVIFPGGFGTMDEFMDVMTQMQTKKIPVSPIILIGQEYWAPFMVWVQTAVKEGLIPQEHVAYITLTDDLEKATTLLVEYCERCMNLDLQK